MSFQHTHDYCEFCAAVEKEAAEALHQLELNRTEHQAAIQKVCDLLKYAQQELKAERAEKATANARMIEAQHRANAWAQRAAWISKRLFEIECELDAVRKDGLHEPEKEEEES